MIGIKLKKLIDRAEVDVRQLTSSIRGVMFGTPSDMMHGLGINHQKEQIETPMLCVQI